MCVYSHVLLPKDVLEHHMSIIIVVIITCLVQSPVPRASPQMPVGRTDVDSIVQLLRTTQETLIHGLTHSHLDVNYVGEQGMTLLHYAAMV